MLAATSPGGLLLVTGILIRLVKDIIEVVRELSLTAVHSEGMLPTPTTTDRLLGPLLKPFQNLPLRQWRNQ